MVSLNAMNKASIKPAGSTQRRPAPYGAVRSKLGHVRAPESIGAARHVRIASTLLDRHTPQLPNTQEKLWAKVGLEGMSKLDVQHLLTQLQVLPAPPAPAQGGDVMARDEGFLASLPRTPPHPTSTSTPPLLEQLGEAGLQLSPQQAAAMYQLVVVGAEGVAPHSPAAPAAVDTALAAAVALAGMGHTPPPAVVARLVGAAAVRWEAMGGPQWDALLHLASRHTSAPVAQPALASLVSAVMAYAAPAPSSSAAPDLQAASVAAATLAALVARGGAQAALVAPLAEALEPLLGAHRAALTIEQLCHFTSLLRACTSPALPGWLSACREALISTTFTAHPVPTLVTAAQLLASCGGWQGTHAPILMGLLSALAATPAAAAAAVSGPPLSSSASAAQPPSLLLSAEGQLQGGAGQAGSAVTVLEWIAGLVASAPSGEAAAVVSSLQPAARALVEGVAQPHLASLPPARLPALLTLCAQLRFSPSPEFVEACFSQLAAGAADIEGAALLAALRATRDLNLRPPHALLAKLVAHQPRVLEGMGARDYLALVELMVATRFVPPRDALRAFFTAASTTMPAQGHSLSLPGSSSSSHGVLLTHPSNSGVGGAPTIPAHTHTSTSGQGSKHNSNSRPSSTHSSPPMRLKPQLKPSEALRALHALSDLREVLGCHRLELPVKEMERFRSQVVDALHHMSTQPQAYSDEE